MRLNGIQNILEQVGIEFCFHLGEVSPVAFSRYRIIPFREAPIAFICATQLYEEISCNAPEDDQRRYVQNVVIQTILFLFLKYKKMATEIQFAVKKPTSNRYNLKQSVFQSES